MLGAVGEQTTVTQPRGGLGNRYQRLTHFFP